MRILTLEEMDQVAGGRGSCGGSRSKPKHSRKPSKSKGKCGGSSNSNNSSSSGGCTTPPPPPPPPPPPGG